LSRPLALSVYQLDFVTKTEQEIDDRFGCNTFNTEIDLAPNQKFVLKTDMVKSASPGLQEPK
jgi:hypothetical protein